MGFPLPVGEGGMHLQCQKITKDYECATFCIFPSDSSDNTPRT